jgi:hypothetical protein
MTPFTWAATALSVVVLACLAALPTARSSAESAARTATDSDALLLRVEREVTAPLRERDADRWRFSRVHRPAPAYRTTPDRARTDRRHAGFRIAAAPAFGGAERDLWLVRVDRRSGVLELAPAPVPGAKAELHWQPFTPELLAR